jgi:cytochrome c-type biogenesis protein CcmF
LHSTLAGDVYVTLLEYADGGSSVTIQAQVNPLVNWLWIGGAVMVLGGIIALWPSRSRRRDPTSSAVVSKSDLPKPPAACPEPQKRPSPKGRAKGGGNAR